MERSAISNKMKSLKGWKRKVSSRDRAAKEDSSVYKLQVQSIITKLSLQRNTGQRSPSVSTEQDDSPIPYHMVSSGTMTPTSQMMDSLEILPSYNEAVANENGGQISRNIAGRSLEKGFIASSTPVWPATQS